MKPLHIGLLIVGAALAGGLAVKMTEVQPIPVAAIEAIHVVQEPAPPAVAPPVPDTAPVNATAPPVNVAPAKTAPAKTAYQKPSPMPRRIAPAPAPVFL
jgi:hypothetical protein